MYTFNNSITLIGNLGKDVEMTTLASGATVAKLSVVTSSFYKDKNGEKVVKTEWHPCEAWNRTAENMAKFLKKGTKVIVRGELNHDSYKTKEGDTRYFSKVKVHEFQSLSLKEEKLPF